MHIEQISLIVEQNLQTSLFYDKLFDKVILLKFLSNILISRLFASQLEIL